MMCQRDQMWSTRIAVDRGAYRRAGDERPESCFGSRECVRACLRSLGRHSAGCSSSGKTRNGIELDVLLVTAKTYGARIRDANPLRSWGLMSNVDRVALQVGETLSDLRLTPAARTEVFADCTPVTTRTEPIIRFRSLGIRVTDWVVGSYCADRSRTGFTESASRLVVTNAPRSDLPWLVRLNALTE